MKNMIFLNVYLIMEPNFKCFHCSIFVWVIFMQHILNNWVFVFWGLFSLNKVNQKYIVIIKTLKFW